MMLGEQHSEKESKKLKASDMMDVSGEIMADEKVSSAFLSR